MDKISEKVLEYLNVSARVHYGLKLNLAIQLLEAKIKYKNYTDSFKN